MPIPRKAHLDEALKEGLQVGLDLSREEREFHQVKQGLFSCSIRK